MEFAVRFAACRAPFPLRRHGEPGVLFPGIGIANDIEFCMKHIQHIEMYIITTTEWQKIAVLFYQLKPLWATRVRDDLEWWYSAGTCNWICSNDSLKLPVIASDSSFSERIKETWWAQSSFYTVGFSFTVSQFEYHSYLGAAFIVCDLMIGFISTELPLMMQS